MFFDIFSELCSKKGVSTYKACTAVGLNRSAVAKWKVGSTPNGATIALLADYFGVTTDYLLGNQQKETPIQADEREISFDDFTYAMYEEGKGLTSENKQKLLEMAKFFKQQQEKRE